MAALQEVRMEWRQGHWLQTLPQMKNLAQQAKSWKASAAVVHRSELFAWSAKGFCLQAKSLRAASSLSDLQNAKQY